MHAKCVSCFAPRHIWFITHSIQSFVSNHMHICFNPPKSWQQFCSLFLFLSVLFVKGQVFCDKCHLVVNLQIARIFPSTCSPQELLFFLQQACNYYFSSIMNQVSFVMQNERVCKSDLAALDQVPTAKASFILLPSTSPGSATGFPPEHTNPVWTGVQSCLKSRFQHDFMISFNRSEAWLQVMIHILEILGRFHVSVCLWVAFVFLL